MPSRNEYMNYYCSLPLSELRRRQHINEMQTIQAYRKKQTIGLIRLQRVWQLLTAAILKTYA